MSSKIQQVLAKIAECDPRKDETINSGSYKRRLATTVSDLSDDDWDKLPEKAQDFVNLISDLINAKKGDDLPAWPDLETSDESKPAGRRRTRASDDEPSGEGSGGFKTVDVDSLKKGDKVRITNKRDKVYEGTVIDPDDKGELVLGLGDDEIGIDLDRVAKAEVWTEAASDEKPTDRRRRKADDDEPEMPEPEVSDTVELITMRDKIVVGNIIEMTKDVIVVKTADGEELEYSRERIKSIKVKVKNAGRSGSSKDKDDGAGKDDGKRKRTVSKSEDGVSATTRARELIIENMGDDVTTIAKKLAKEDLDVKENTLKLIFSDTHRLLAMLKVKKLLK